jgi:segregation and condensation protein B
MNPRDIIEALLFSAEEALSVKDILKIVSDINNQQVEELITELNKTYEESGRSFGIDKVADGYMFVTKQMYSPYIRKLHKAKRLSTEALEVLAIVAYRGPCTKQTVDKIRGVDSSSSLKTLINNQLIEIKAGRPLKYATTDKFLEVFGLNSLADLPDTSQFQEAFGDETNP